MDVPFFIDWGPQVEKYQFAEKLFFAVIASVSVAIQ